MVVVLVLFHSQEIPAFDVINAVGNRCIPHGSARGVEYVLLPALPCPALACLSLLIVFSRW